MLCVENCTYWNHYKHYNKYKDYNNTNIKVYLYNHINKIKLTETYIAIPVIYLQINYLKKFYNIIKPITFTSYEDKKFCLIATKCNTYYKKKVYNMLSSIVKCDFISDYSNIKNKSCYHDEELLNLFNQYKFVFVSENSICDGYITEKIFNCYFSRVIPIYYGSPIITYYFKHESFINIEKDFENIDVINKIINNLINNKELQENYITANIINDNYDDENYKDQLNNFISKNSF